jgi:hypothetical protein
MIFTFPETVQIETLPDIARWAIAEHGPQMYGRHPYSSHLAHVHAIVSYFSDDEDIRKAAWTHDLCEDKGKSKRDIAERSNERVGEISWAVSGFGETRAEKLLCVKRKIPEVPGSEIAKMGDRGGNIQKCIEDMNLSLLKVYVVKEHDSLAEVLPLTHPMREWLEGVVEEGRILLTSKPGKIMRPR